MSQEPGIRQHSFTQSHLFVQRTTLHKKKMLLKTPRHIQPPVESHSKEYFKIAVGVEIFS